MRRAPLAIAALLAASSSMGGCTVDDSYSGVGFQCSMAEPCPSGLECVAGTCQLSTSIVDAGVDDPDGGGAEVDAGAVACLPPIAVSDDFEADTLDVGRWLVTTDQNTAVSQADGLLALQPAISRPQKRFASVQSVDSFDLSEHQVVVEVAAMTGAEAHVISEIAIGVDNNNYYAIRHEEGVLFFEVSEAGQLTTIGTNVYNATNDRWWQMTIEGQSAIARTSPDGATWTELGHSDSLPVTGDMLLRFRAGTTRSVQAPGELHLDNVNSGAGLCE